MFAVVVRCERVAKEVEVLCTVLGCHLIERRPELGDYQLRPRHRVGRACAAENDEAVGIAGDTGADRFTRPVLRFMYRFSSIWTCPTTAATGAYVELLPHLQRPSPFRLGGSRVDDFTFKAVPGFTQVAARWIAQPPQCGLCYEASGRLPNQTASLASVPIDW